MNSGLIDIFEPGVCIAILGIIVSIIIAIINLGKDNKRKYGFFILLFAFVLSVIVLVYLETKYKNINEPNKAYEYSTITPSTVKNYNYESSISERVKITSVFDEYDSESEKNESEDSLTNKDNYAKQAYQPDESKEYDFSSELSENTTDYFTSLPTSYFTLSTSKTVDDYFVKDCYDSGGYLINGIFGSQKNEEYFRFDNKTNEWIEYDKSDINNINLNKIKLEFYDESDNIIDGGNLFVSVPQALQERHQYWRGLLPVNQTRTDELFCFQTGLYVFALEYGENGEWYQSDCVYIDEEATYLIRVNK